MFSVTVYVSCIILQLAVHLQPCGIHFRSKSPPDVFVAQVGLSGFSQRISPPKPHNDSASGAPCPSAVRWQSDVARHSLVVTNTRRMPNPKCHVILNTMLPSPAATLLRWPELQHPNIFLPPLYQSYFWSLIFVSVRNSNFIWVIVIG